MEQRGRIEQDRAVGERGRRGEVGGGRGFKRGGGENEEDGEGMSGGGEGWSGWRCRLRYIVCLS